LLRLAIKEAKDSFLTTLYRFRSPAPAIFPSKNLQAERKEQIFPASLTACV
jgi:hypothetical protein